MKKKEDAKCYYCGELYNQPHKRGCDSPEAKDLLTKTNDDLMRLLYEVFKTGYDQGFHETDPEKFDMFFKDLWEERMLKILEKEYQEGWREAESIGLEQAKIIERESNN